MELQSCSTFNKIVLTALAIIKGLSTSFSFHLEAAKSNPSESLVITDPRVWKTTKKNTKHCFYYTVSLKTYSFERLNF